ncbi:MAG TPA: aminotransferase class V-fold PLP-dependent enzyme [Candidatus Dormibacteraeota bacterium]|nr:aminotransferase class V-fold PLP-dependent enzyme [Candidatus Dormibacteraeota bacterium]
MASNLPDGAPPLDRSLFAVTRSHAYLNHAAVGVLPIPTAAALHEFIDAQARGGVLGTFPYEAEMAQYRAVVARSIGARSSEIAILRNTSEGANAIAAGLNWSPGDEVLLPADEFPSNALPWRRLRNRGVLVRELDVTQERLTPERLDREIGDRTRLVTLSWIAYADGYRHDLAGLAKVAHSHGALFVVDAIQGLGALELDVERCGVDALYAGGAKWLCALQGSALLYVAPTLLERLDVAAPGWRTPADMWDFHNESQGWIGDTTRFEGGTPNFIGALSLARSLDLFASVGIARIERHVLALRSHLLTGLRDLGATVVTNAEESVGSGIVTFSFSNRESVTLGRELQREGFVTTWRTNGIRVSPHGYNEHAEIDAFLLALARAL